MNCKTISHVLKLMDGNYCTTGTLSELALCYDALAHYYGLPDDSSDGSEYIEVAFSDGPSEGSHKVAVAVTRWQWQAPGGSSPL